MKIGEFARRVGVPIDTVRFYERNGVLPPPQRRVSGYRIYGDEDVARMRFVLRSKSAGFTLMEIRELLELSDTVGDDVERLRVLASTKLEEVEQRIERLEHIRGALKTLVEADPEQARLHSCPVRTTLTGNKPR
jgi:MerR family copper efflux transcriptional regulator